MIRINFLKSLFALVVMVAVLSACNKEEITELDNVETTAATDVISKLVDTEIIQSGDADEASQKNDCFTFNYPITIVETDGAETEIVDDAGLEDFLKTNYRGGGDKDDLTLAWPVEVTLEDGSIEAINNDEELEELLEDCFEKYEGGHHGGDRGGHHGGDRGDHDKDRCFEVIFPITIMLADGTEAAVDSKRDLRQLVKGLKEEGEDGRSEEDEKPFTIAFPIEVMLEDESITSIESEEGFEELKESCED